MDTDLASQYLTLISQMPKETVLIGNRDPPFFVIPYIRNMLLVYFSTFKSEHDAEDLDNFDNQPGYVNDADYADDKLFQMQFESAGLSKLQCEIERIFHNSYASEARKKYSSVLNDISSLRNEYETSATHFRRWKDGGLVAAQMEEARASTKAAVTVNRLSKLAFVFIPLSFTTSFFGMNVVEWGQGTTHLRTFFVTAVAVSICSLIPLMPSILHTVKKSRWWDPPLV